MSRGGVGVSKVKYTNSNARVSFNGGEWKDAKVSFSSTESERNLYALGAEPSVPKPPDLLRLGEFRPHWDQGYSSFHEDRKALWRHVVADAVQNTHLRPENLQAYSDVRNPEFHKQDWTENTITDWHCDNHVQLGATTQHANEWMVVWANCQPTEIRAQDGQITQGDPYELIAFRNGSYEHRMPYMTAEEAGRRWFARQYIDVPVPVSAYDSWNGHEMRNIVYNPGMYVTQKHDVLLDEVMKYKSRPMKGSLGAWRQEKDDKHLAEMMKHMLTPITQEQLQGIFTSET